jgi:hypothetical protein
MAKREGRPTKYDPKFARQAAKLCEFGATDMEIADCLGVNVSTIYRWRNTHPDFCEAVRAGKDHSDERVERAFYQRAVGYTFESEKVFQFQGAIVRADTREHVPPDPGAAFNWLKNRRGEKWREKSELTGANGTSLIPEQTDTDLARLTVFLLTKAQHETPAVQ